MPNRRRSLNFNDKDLWYLVGLIATDGCLSSDGRHINITSKNREFLEQLAQKFVPGHRIGVKNKDRKNLAYHLEFSNIELYEFLLSIGLMPRKSLRLNALDVPYEYFADFFRGIIDGDGSIRAWIHRANGIEQWSLSIYSASPDFVHWLEKITEGYFEAKGRIHREKRELPHHDLYVLKYGKMAAMRILAACYYKDSFCLKRKEMLAGKCNAASIGWSRSKTLLGKNFAAGVA